MAKLTKQQIKHRKFIASKEWKAIRENLFRIRGKQCEKCGSVFWIQVHHLHYNKPYGEELPGDLQVLCSKCHKAIHKKKSKKKRKKGKAKTEWSNIPWCFRAEYKDNTEKNAKKKAKRLKRKNKKLKKQDPEKKEFKLKTVIRKKIK